MHHNLQARRATDTILQNWRDGSWQNPNISTELHLTKVDTNFPSPDGCLFEPRSKTRIALEFKPGDRETQRGLLTGIGQCIAYLNKNGAAYLIAPNSVSDNSRIGDYLEETFKKNIYHKLPIGLITYSDHDFNNLRLRCDISSRIRLQITTGDGVDVNYWAAWRDTPPHAIYLLLKVAEELADDTERSKKIWDNFYFGYYVINNSEKTLEDIPSNIKLWDGVTPQVPLQGIKNKLRAKVANGEITEADALDELAEKTNPNIADNNYRDIKKNHYNFVNHLSLWSPNYHLTEYGRRLLEIGNKYGGESEQFKNALGYLMLEQGRHRELINDIKAALSSTVGRLSSIEDVRSICYRYLEVKGYIKKNPNRATTHVRNSFSSEFGVWAHFGILNKQGNSFFDENNGLSFNDNVIEKLIISGLRIFR